MFDNLLKRAILVSVVAFTVFASGCKEEPGTGITKNNSTEKKLFDYQLSELSNGMKVVSVEDFSTPIAAVGECELLVDQASNQFSTLLPLLSHNQHANDLLIILLRLVYESYVNIWFVRIDNSYSGSAIDNSN